ncbi:MULTISPECIES: TonB-dependent receptor [Butyricimonas]|uniref:TonB-dependent receptor n=1 Tax=Butyricimonas TaxID=574697 RepID=UPI0007FB3267|nr:MULTISPECIES: TonB-dependent receptor [Butyricimonas]
MNKIRGNKVIIGVLIMFMPILWGPVRSVAAVSSSGVNVQQKDGKKVTLNIVDRNLTYILSEIKQQTGFAYGFKDSRNAVQNERFSINVHNVSVDSALTVLLKNSRYTYQIEGNLILILTRQDKIQQVDKNDLITVKGRVVDEKGNPVAGATVVIHGTTRGVASDAEGQYSIDARPDDVLRVSFIGYKTETVDIKGKTRLNVRLNPTEENLEEVQVVAFGAQKKESVVSAITTIRPMDLKSSSSDLTSQLTGKIAGIIGWQTGGLPGALTEEEMNTKFYIRGISSSNGVSEPLVLIDGVESSRLDLARMAPEDIESFSVLKDASATAMYGARGANGVILVTTKKGQEGSVYTTVRYETVWSMPTDNIDVVDPKTYMRMYNQALLARNPNATPAYTLERIERTGNPNYPSYVYPANDWYDIMFRNFSVNHRAGINARGGSSVVQYYASVNYNYDSGILKTDRLNQFDVNIKNSTISSRVNLNVNLSAGIQLLWNNSFSLDKYHGPMTDAASVYAAAFTASPVDFAAIYPADKATNWPHLRFGSIKTSSGHATNPYADVQTGYIERGRYSVTSRMEYLHNLSSLIKGLELRASVSLTKQGYDQTAYGTRPYYYYLDPEINYDFETGEHTLQKVQDGIRTLSVPGDMAYATSSTQWVYEGRLLHTAAWDDHQTSLTAVLQAIQSNGAPASSLFSGIEHRNVSFSMRGSYGFKDRYFVEGSFGYNGSERFAKSNRMGFFPAVGAAWVVSKEGFMQGISRELSFLKLRASWGKVGNDGIIKEPRFVYMPQIEKAQAIFSGYYPDAGMPSEFVRYQIQNYGDPGIEWEVSEQINLGVETRFFKDFLELNADFYQEIRHNIIANRTVIPANMGVELPPLDNIGKVRSRGVDLSAKVQHAFSPDCWIILNGTFTYSKAVYKELEEAVDKPAWQLFKGHDISQQIGYIAEGLFCDEAEIMNSPQANTGIMPGDIRYRDVDKNGVIDTRDAVHIGYPQTPRIVYGFSGFINYKNWEFNFAFQGSGHRSFFINPVKISPFVNGNAMLKAIYEDHWTEENMSNRPFWPRLSVSSIATYNQQENWNNVNSSETRKSTYFMRECSFLRCTSLELAYNLPESVRKKLRMQNLKFFVRANNPFLISNFDLWDVELGESGFNYPIQKTYAVGVNISF